MAGGSSPTVLKDLATLYRNGTVAGLSDGQLLERFLNGPDEAAEGAFAALLGRHGAMVRRTCRQVLGNSHDAEDASQATFLVLARKAGSIQRSSSVAGWLHGVASRVAARAKVDAARQRARERRGAETSPRLDIPEAHPESWPELHEELGRLPEKFRLAIVLCHFEGLSHEQAAQRIGCPPRTVQSRLARGRERLRARLARRGLGPAAALLANALAPESTSAAVTDPWTESTVKAAVRQAAGATSTASVSATVAALSEGVLRAMMLEKLKSVAAVAAFLGVVACSMGGLARSAPPGPSAPAPVAKADPDRRYQVKTSDGTTVEVVGISTHPSGPKTWWKPDGSPLAEAPIDPSDPLPFRASDGAAREILVRITGLPEGATLKWSPTHNGRSWGVTAKKDGQRVPGLEMYIASFTPTDSGTCAVQVRVSAGPWTTEQSDVGTGGRSYVHNDKKYYFGKARAYRGGTSIAVAQNIVGRDSRVVAIDLDGTVHTPVYSSGAGGEILSLLDVEFPVPPDRIRSYQVQSRPFERVEIKDIPLDPLPRDASRKPGRPQAEPRPLAKAARFEDVYLLDQPYTIQRLPPFGTWDATSWALGVTTSLPMSNRPQGSRRDVDRNAPRTR